MSEFFSDIQQIEPAITFSSILNTLLFIWFFALMVARTLNLFGINKASWKQDFLITFMQSFIITLLVETWIYLM